MLVTIAPMIAKNKLRDLCRGAIFLLKKNSFLHKAFRWYSPFRRKIYSIHILYTLPTDLIIYPHIILYIHTHASLTWSAPKKTELLPTQLDVFSGLMPAFCIEACAFFFSAVSRLPFCKSEVVCHKKKSDLLHVCQ